MKNTFRTIVMLIAVFSVGGYFLNQQAMAGTVGSLATATIDPSCSLTPGAFVFGNLDTIANVAGSAEIVVTMANNALSNKNSDVSVSGDAWRSVATSTDIIMVSTNTQFDLDNVTGGPYQGISGTIQSLIVVNPGNTDDTFWIVLAVLNGAQGTGFTGDIDQAITLDFACV